MNSPSKPEIWLAAGVRTPFAKVDGPLAKLDAIGLSVPVVQQMINEQQEVCCEARFVIGLFDLQARKLMLPTPEWLRALGLPES